MILRLRQLEIDPSATRIIRSERGVGYGRDRIAAAISWLTNCIIERFAAHGHAIHPTFIDMAGLENGGNAARLRALKRRFDPDGVFASAIPLPEG